MTDPQTADAESRYRFRFEHVESLLGPFNGDSLDDGILAALLGPRWPVYREVRDASRRTVARAVDELAGDDEFRCNVRALPFGAG